MESYRIRTEIRDEKNGEEIPGSSRSKQSLLFLDMTVACLRNIHIIELRKCVSEFLIPHSEAQISFNTKDKKSLILVGRRETNR